MSISIVKPSKENLSAGDIEDAGKKEAALLTSSKEAPKLDSYDQMVYISEKIQQVRRFLIISLRDLTPSYSKNIYILVFSSQYFQLSSV